MKKTIELNYEEMNNIISDRTDIISYLGNEDAYIKSILIDYLGIANTPYLHRPFELGDEIDFIIWCNSITYTRNREKKSYTINWEE